MNRIITAKFSSSCAETGNKIKKGDTILYNPSLRKAYCKGSMAFQDHNSNPDAGIVEAQENAYFDNFCYQNGI